MEKLEETINAVLNDPAQMQQILSLAQSLGFSPPEAPETPHADAPEPGGETPKGSYAAPVAELLQQAGKMDKKQENLLNALKPFLKPGRREKIDRAMQVARFSNLAGYALRRHDNDG